MSKGLLLTVAFLLLGAGATAFLLTTADSPEENQQQQASTEQTASTDRQLNSEGPYQDFSEASFANTEGTRILFFHAPWCPQCRQIDAEIQANLDKIPSGVTIFKIDYDSNQKLRQMYDVRLQTTLIKLNTDGEVVASFVPYYEPTFENVQENIF